MDQRLPLSPERRSFLSRLQTGVASLAGIVLGGSAMAQAASAASKRWEPAHHAKDDWLDELPGQHRLVFDTISAQGLSDALMFAGTYVRINESEYGLSSKDLAVVVVMRHRSTMFAYNDAMWAKYGAPLASRSSPGDPSPNGAPTANIYASNLQSVTAQGIQLAVCAAATRRMAGIIAKEANGDADAINRELIANVVKNARMVPAGIVALNRAQERGYSLVAS
jgi:intracellular sulfur oxidation DsrE/DsrF family protein